MRNWIAYMLIWICLVWFGIVLWQNIDAGSDWDSYSQPTTSHTDNYDIISKWYYEHNQKYEIFESKDEYKQVFDENYHDWLDFEEYDYVAIFMEEDWDIFLENLSIYHDELIFDVLYQYPGENCEEENFENNTYKLLEVEKLDRPISVFYFDEYVDC